MVVVVVVVVEVVVVVWIACMEVTAFISLPSLRPGSSFHCQLENKPLQLGKEAGESSPLTVKMTNLSQFFG